MEIRATIRTLRTWYTPIGSMEALSPFKLTHAGQRTTQHIIQTTIISSRVVQQPNGTSPRFYSIVVVLPQAHLDKLPAIRPIPQTSVAVPTPPQPHALVAAPTPSRNNKQNKPKRTHLVHPNAVGAAPTPPTPHALVAADVVNPTCNSITGGHSLNHIVG
jgi:hypothetical protein